MGLPVDEARIREAEEALGRSLPEPLRERLMHDNGGDVTVSGGPGDDPVWQLHPVWDPTDRKTSTRSASHIARETEEAGDDLPEGAVAIAGNGTGDRLVLVAESDDPQVWDHETGDLHPVTVEWAS
jgi:hypothetical protein